MTTAAFARRRSEDVYRCSGIVAHPLLPLSATSTVCTKVLAKFPKFVSQKVGRSNFLVKGDWGEMGHLRVAFGALDVESLSGPRCRSRSVLDRAQVSETMDSSSGPKAWRSTC